MKKGSGSYFRRSREALNTRTAKIGGFSAVLTVIVLAILIAANLFVNSLPSTWTHFDISASRLYSLTSATKSVVNNLDRDVSIYWIVQANEEDEVLGRLLDVYDAMSDKISVIKENPDIYPTFAQQYTEDVVSNNSLVVESGSKNRFISFSDIYEYDTTAYYSGTGSISSSFDGEGEITAAIDYVRSDVLPKIYVLNGHEELEAGDSFTSALTRANFETTTFSLLNIDEIPEDAACILINAPSGDISEEEANMLRDYMSAGGSVIVFSGLKEEEPLVNLQSLLGDYKITVSDGIVIEGDRSRYAFRTPYVIIPSLGTLDITQSLIDHKSNVIVPIAQGLVISSDSLLMADVHSLIATSNDAFAKPAGYAIETYDKEEGDTDGPFSLGVSIESRTGGKLVWFSTDYLLDETYNSYSSGANIVLAMNSISWMAGQSDAISVRAKSLDYNYLTISESQAGIIKIILIGAIPLVCLIFGIDEVIRRRKSK